MRAINWSSRPYILGGRSDSNLICARLDAGLGGEVGLEGVDGESADGVLWQLEATSVMNVPDWKSEKYM